MKMPAQTLSINGIEYIVPGHMSDKEVSALCAMLVHFRRVDEVYSADYKERFRFQESEYVMVRLALRDLYVSEGVARTARDAHNEALVTPAPSQTTVE